MHQKYIHLCHILFTLHTVISFLIYLFSFSFVFIYHCISFNTFYFFTLSFNIPSNLMELNFYNIIFFYVIQLHLANEGGPKFKHTHTCTYAVSARRRCGHIQIWIRDGMSHSMKKFGMMGIRAETFKTSVGWHCSKFKSTYLIRFVELDSSEV